MTTMSNILRIAEIRDRRMRRTTPRASDVDFLLGFASQVEIANQQSIAFLNVLALARAWMRDDAPQMIVDRVVQVSDRRIWALEEFEEIVQKVQAFDRAFEALQQYTVSPEDAEAMRIWVLEGRKVGEV